MTLRLDPAIPLVWRDPHTLQLGVDPAVAVLHGLTPALERLVAALVTGVTASGFRMLASTQRVGDAQRERLLTTLEACLLPEADAEPSAAGRAMVLGTGPLAAPLARVLDDLALRTTDPEHAALAVLVADRVVLPADHRAWLQRDVPHLPVIAGDASVTVGPLVLPGATACLHCVALHRRDADPAWPAIAAQLARLPAPAAHPLRAASAVAHAARMVAGALRGEPDAGRELRITADGGQLSERVVAPHPECRCAAPPGSDWAPAGGPAAPPPPNAARESAGHA
jgi:bacteriocin biosynthesis cyclodehydratase domain-containing protein